MLWVFGNTVLGKKFGSGRDGATRDWTQILNGNFYRGNAIVFNELQDKLYI
jgi:hypothetical protein